MPEEPIVCRFVYTLAEYRRALRCNARFSPLRKRMTVFLAIIYLGMLVVLPFLLGFNWEGLIATAVIAAIMVIMLLLVYFFGWRMQLFLVASRRFRRNSAFNKEVVYAAYTNGLNVKTEMIESNVKWELFAYAAENEDGIALVHKGRMALNWFSKSGFANAGEFARFLELIRRSIADVRGTGNRRS